MNGNMLVQLHGDGRRATVVAQPSAEDKLHCSFA